MSEKVVKRVSPGFKLLSEFGVGTALNHPLVAMMLDDAVVQLTADEAVRLGVNLVEHAHTILERDIIPIDTLIKDPDDDDRKLYGRLYNNYEALRATVNKASARRKEFNDAN